MNWHCTAHVKLTLTAHSWERHSGSFPMQLIPSLPTHKARVWSPPTSHGLQATPNDSRTLLDRQSALLRPRGFSPANRAARLLMAKLTWATVTSTSLGFTTKNSVHPNVPSALFGRLHNAIQKRGATQTIRPSNLQKNSKTEIITFIPKLVSLKKKHEKNQLHSLPLLVTSYDKQVHYGLFWPSAVQG